MEQRHFHERYTVKKYDPNQKVSHEDIELMKEAFHLSPSSLNVQGWKLIVVESGEEKERLSSAAQHGNAHRTRECSHIFVFARKQAVGLAHYQRIIQKTKMLDLTRESMGVKLWQLALFMRWYQFRHGGKHWLGRQLYIPLGILMAICAEHGIGSTPMEGFHWRKVDKLLGLKGYQSEVALAVGYPAEEDKDNPSRQHKDRLPYDEVIEHR